MKKILLITLIAGALAATSCKTTEENYRKAYVTAKENKNLQIDEETQSRIDQEKYGLKTDINGIGVRIKNEFVKPVEPEDQQLPKCGVVVGSFKQIFNAKMFRKRLADKGHPSFVVSNREEQFYVIIKGFENEKEAASYIADFKNIVNMTMPIPPFILSIPSVD